MAQLNVRIDDHARTGLDDLAAARGTTTADLVRSMIDAALGREDPERPYGDLTPTSLSVLDRQRLALQHRILGLLADGDPADHEHLVDILENGYTAEYHRLFAGMNRELTAHQCTLVQDILDMFRMLASSWQRLNEDEQEAVRRSNEHADRAMTFAGFDLADPLEGQMLNYTRHLIDGGKWQELAESVDDRHEYGHSHARRLPTYQRMLTAFRPIWQTKIASGGAGGREAYAMSAPEIQRVLDAWPYRA